MTTFNASLKAKAAAELERRRREKERIGQWRNKVAVLEPHERQREFIESSAPRKVIRAGRRGGKTVGIAILAVRTFLTGKRVLYAAPTADQLSRFWTEVTRMLAPATDTGELYKNETEHVIEVPGTENRIRAKTAWNAETLRGDYADLLIFDEFQLIAEDAWEVVGAPMLLDNNGDAVFIYTPPSLSSKFRTKARDPQNAAKMFKRAAADTSGRWAAFHFSSHDNPHISAEALEDLTLDMTRQAYEQEILAIDRDESPGALWTRALIDAHRVRQMPPDLVRISIGVDPPGGRTECGIVVAGLASNGHAYVLEDVSLQASPELWAQMVMSAAEDWEADRIVAEANFGGDMVKSILKNILDENKSDVRLKIVHASRGKAVRAEPIAARYERGHVHHVGGLPHLENEQCNWLPDAGMPSPNRLDALVWALTDLLLKSANQVASSRQG